MAVQMSGQGVYTGVFLHYNISKNGAMNAMCPPEGGDLLRIRNGQDYVDLFQMTRTSYHCIALHSRCAGWAMPMHAHDFWQVFVVLHGAVYLCCEEKTVRLTRGMVSLLPPGLPHRIWAEEDYSQFGAEILDRAEDTVTALLRENITDHKVILFNDILLLSEEAVGMLDEIDRVSVAMLTAQMDMLLLRILRRVMADQTEQFQRRLEQYLDENLSVRLTVEQIAAHMHLSTSHCERLCRKYYGCGLIALMHRLRSALACELLSMTTLSVSEIGRRVGFSDVRHFYRFFKNMNGMTPAAYRIST